MAIIKRERHTHSTRPLHIRAKIARSRRAPTPHQSSLASRIQLPLSSRISRPRRRRAPRPRRANIPLNIQTDRIFKIDACGTKAFNDIPKGFRRLESDLCSLVVAIKGCCLRNGLDGAVSSYGVYFCPNRPNAPTSNIGEKLPSSFRQTNNHADLFGLKVALDKVLDLVRGGERFSHVVLKTDSKYMVNGLTLYVWRWEENGYISSKNRRVVNMVAFAALHRRIRELEEVHRVKVSFCWVDKKYNKDAGELATNALSRGVL